jgi:nicotinamidase-related amidase
MTDAAGKAPGATALLIVDMINDFAFEEAGALLDRAEDIAEVIDRLRGKADQAGVPTVYVNDNYGQWHSERDKIIDYCRGRNERGRMIIDRLRPREQDYFIIKPQFSGFYATNLPVVLPQIGVSRLILTGIAADICVLFTAADAHMRAYDLWVPRDAVASSQDAHRDWAIGIMEKSMDAETRASTEYRLEAWIERAG